MQWRHRGPVSISVGLCGLTKVSRPFSTEQTSGQNAAAAQKIKQDLAGAGFTGVKVVAETFVVQAKTKDGNPVLMTNGPRGMSVFEAMNAGQHSARTILGQGTGDAGSINWSVLGPDKLQRVIEGPQHTTTMTVAVTGTTCKLEVTYELKSGFKEFKFKQLRNGQPGFFTQPEVAETKRSIR
jgi:hypothetical protein